VYDSSNGARVAKLRGGHTCAVASAAFLELEADRRRGGTDGGPGERWLVSVGNDQAMCLWRWEEGGRGRLVRRVEGLPGKPNYMVCAGSRIFLADTTSELSVIGLRAPSE
jgi:hypothetical protein